jgi:ABC-type transport system involved in multi-copper enzyme maturation permease subunit
MFGTICRFEIRYHLTRPVTYLYLAFFVALAFLLIATDAVSISGSSGQVKRNAPYVTAQAMLLLVAIGQVILTGLVGTAVLRDYQYRTHELLFTTPISRFAYLGGRFVGAFVVMVIVHLGIPIGLIAGSMMPWVDPTKLLPFNGASYLVPFVLLVLPSVFLLSAIFFAVGALSRSLFAIYTQGIFLLVAWNVVGQLLSDVSNRAAAIFEPFGLQAFTQLTRYWTVAERNSLTVPLAGELLTNRLLWTGVAILLLGVTFAVFRFRSAPPTLRRKKVEEPEVEVGPGLGLGTARVTQRFDGKAWRHQLRSTTRLSFWSIVRQIPFLAIVTVGIVNLIMAAAFSDSLYGEKVWPVTYSMVETLDSGFFLFFVILTTIYAGEAVWRERQLQMDQINDALPARSSVFLFGKIAGLILVQVALLLLMVVAGIAVQTAKGYYNYEIGLYFRYLFAATFPALVQLTVLAVLVHVLVNQKFVGHLVMILFWISRVALGPLGLEHQLFSYGDTPDFTYSDMNGFGPFVPNLVLSAVYWTGVAGILAVIAYLFWVRGTDSRWGFRRRVARLRWNGGIRAVAAAAIVVAVAAGGTIFYNTNILNNYESSKDRRRLQAQYERTYKSLQKIPQPRLIDADVRADLEPERQAFSLAGTLAYLNDQTRPLDSIIVTTTHTELRIDTLQWSREAATLVSDSALGTRIYRLTTPLQPGDTIRLRYRARFEQRGFGNGGPTTDVVENGTFINSTYFPVLGYQESGEIGSDDNRRKEKLPPKERMASLDDESARSDTYLGANANWINFKATVSTAPDQIAIAPGYLVREYQ